MCSTMNDSDFLIIDVSNSKNKVVAFEMRFAKDINILKLKSLLEFITCGNARTMKLELYKGENFISELNDNEAPLDSLDITNGMRIHVVDEFAWNADFESVENSENEENSVRHFLRKHNAGKYDEDEMFRGALERQQQLKDQEEKLNSMKIGDRCQVAITDKPIRLGTIMYKGSIDGRKGTFIGVEYDEPLGKNNGAIHGKVYFTCKPKHGSFVVPSFVEVLKYPVENEGSDEFEF